MAVKNETVADAVADKINYAKLPGYHVMKGSEYLGTYETEEDAESFAEQHPRAAGIDVRIVSGSAE